MELLEGINTRSSFRAFKSTPIPEEIMKTILSTASKSPSYANSQPWEIAVVSGTKKDELGNILCKLVDSDTAPNPDFPTPPPWPEHIDQRIKEHNKKRSQVIGVERTDEQKRKELYLLNFKFYGAPCVLFLILDSTLTNWSVFDMGAFAHSITLAAHSFGLGTCLQAAVVYYPDAIRNSLGMPDTKKILLGISIGYPDFEAGINSYRSLRVGIDDFVQWYG